MTSGRVESTFSQHADRARCRAADLFDVVWVTLVDVIGPTAAAALLERSVRRAAVTHAELRQLTITRQEFEYAYTLPESWSRIGPDAEAALRRLLEELWPLLLELTGPVVVRRLRDVPLLQQCGVLPEDSVQ